MNEYIVLRDANPASLEKRVTVAINEGYIPCGGVNYFNETWSQALLKIK